MEENIVKVFFDSYPILTKEGEVNNQKIISLLNKYSCNVVQTVMGVEFSYQEPQGKRAAANIYNSKLNDIRDNDICVCEISIVSPTLVFEIFEAIDQKKPVLALYSEKGTNVSDIAFLGNPSSLLHLESYNEVNLETKISDFLKKAKKQIPGNRFTVRLTKELSDYLDYLKGKMHYSSKNETVLSILEKIVREDADYRG